MRVVLEGESRIRLEVTGEGFEITAEGVAISPYHLLAASLASCTAHSRRAAWQRVVWHAMPLMSR